jgi:hypothetical protein
MCLFALRVECFRVKHVLIVGCSLPVHHLLRENSGQLYIDVAMRQQRGGAESKAQLFRFVVDSVGQKDNGSCTVYRVGTKRSNQFETCDHRQVGAANHEIKLLYPGREEPIQPGLEMHDCEVLAFKCLGDLLNDFFLPVNHKYFHYC